MPTPAYRPSDGACPNDDDTAVPAAMRANACGMRISRNDCPPKWMLVSSGRSQIDRLARARQCEAGNNVVIIE
jgi:hypothetical protein